MRKANKASRHCDAAGKATNKRSIITFGIRKDQTDYFKEEGDPYYGDDEDLGKLDADGFAYAYVGAKEAFDALEWLTPHKITAKYDSDVKDLVGALPEGTIGLNKTACLGNAVHSYLTNRTRWASDDGNGYLDDLIKTGDGDVKMLRKVVVEKLKREKGFKLHVICLTHQNQDGEVRKRFGIKFPVSLLDGEAFLCLPGLVANELGLDAMTPDSSDKLTMRLIERTDASPACPPYMGPIEDEAILVRWDIVLQYGNSQSTLKWPRGSRGDQVRSRFFSFLREHVEQAPFEVVWQRRKADLGWPTLTALPPKPDDIPQPRWLSAQLASRAHLTRYQSEREGGNTGIALFKVDGHEYQQRMPLHPSGHPHDILLAIAANGDVSYAHRAVGDLTSPLDWKPFTGNKSKALQILINDCRRLYGLEPLYVIEGEMRVAKSRKGMSDDEIADQLVLGLDLEESRIEVTLLGVRVRISDPKDFGSATRLRLNLALRQAYWSNGNGEWAAQMGTALNKLVTRVKANIEGRAAGQPSKARITLGRNSKRAFVEMDASATGKDPRHGRIKSDASSNKQPLNTSSTGSASSSKQTLDPLPTGGAAKRRKSSEAAAKSPSQGAASTSQSTLDSFVKRSAPKRKTVSGLEKAHAGGDEDIDETGDAGQESDPDFEFVEDDD